MSIVISRDKSLKRYNSFGYEATADTFIEFTNPDDLPDVFDSIGDRQYIVLGGGCNTLFVDSNYSGVVIHPMGQRIDLVAEYSSYVLVEAEAAVDWDAFVEYSLARGYCGVENLTAIPSSIGGVAVQNIGAYGVEACDVIEAVHYYDTLLGEHKVIAGSKCEFGYRNSIFKNELKGRAVITSVLFRLSLEFKPNLSYGALSELQSDSVTPRLISERVRDIRQSKLPNHKEVGNGGSFFKNPVVSQQTYSKLIEQYPDMPSYPDSGGVKLPAAWLIEQAGWRGHTEGSVGVHPKQALVLVHYGGGNGAQMIALADKIIESVKIKFGVEISPEVVIVYNS